MNAKVLFSATFTTLFLASPAIAGETPPGGLPQAKSESNAVLKEIVGPALDGEMDDAGRKTIDGAPNDRVASGFRAKSLQFSSTQGEADLSLAVSFDLGTYDPTRVKNPKDNYFAISRTRVGLVATVPIDKDQTVQKLFSGNSLVTGNKLKLSITHFSTSIGLGSTEANEAARLTKAHAYKACIAEFRNDQPQIAANQAQSQLLTNTEKSIDTYSRANPDNYNVQSYDEVFTNLAESKDDFSKNLAHYCYDDVNNTNGIHNRGSLIQKYAKDEYATFRSAYVKDNVRVSFWGLDASMGRDDHSFLDRTNFKLLSEPRTTWEVGAYYGWISSNLTSSLRAKVVYGQTYKDNDEAEICRSVSIPVGATDCIKGADGAPIRERTGLASVEGRKLVTVDDKTQIALAPQVTYRFEDKNVGVEVPIYLVPDKDGKLSGGIKAVYNSKGDEFAVGLFVGVPFSVFFDK